VKCFVRLTVEVFLIYSQLRLEICGFEKAMSRT
jgi:hypothetical protein